MYIYQQKVVIQYICKSDELIMIIYYRGICQAVRYHIGFLTALKTGFVPPWFPLGLVEALSV